MRNKGRKVVLVPLPPAVSGVVDRAAGDLSTGPVLPNRRGVRMGRHAATRRLSQLAAAAGVRPRRMHPPKAGVDVRSGRIAPRDADPRTTMRDDRARKNFDRQPCDIAACMSYGT